jgi:copper chaperone CopZ
MKTTLRLEGLDCADCAAKIENKVKKLSGVNNVSVNFVTSKMVIDHNEQDAAKILDEIVAVVKKMEPDVNIKRAL